MIYQSDIYAKNGYVVERGINVMKRAKGEKKHVI